MLRFAGVQTDACSTSEEALKHIAGAHASGRPFDACIVDIDMNDGSGFDIAREVRSTYGTTPLLFALTSSPVKGLVRHCDEAGFNGFLPKPVSRSKLYRMLSHCFGVASDSPCPDAESKVVTRHTLSENAKHSISILVVEDNPVNQKLAVTLLSKAGYQVSVANNGAEAVEQIVSSNPGVDIVFMDVQMPVMNGFEATRHLRERGFTDLPIIAMTAQAIKGDREKCLNAGMNDYIPKPIKRDVVFDMLKQWVIERRAKPLAPVE